MAKEKIKNCKVLKKQLCNKKQKNLPVPFRRAAKKKNSKFEKVRDGS